MVRTVLPETFLVIYYIIIITDGFNAVQTMDFDCVFWSTGFSGTHWPNSGLFQQLYPISGLFSPVKSNTQISGIRTRVIPVYSAKATKVGRFMLT